MYASHIQTMFAYYQINLQIVSETVCLLFNISCGSFFHMIIWYKSTLDASEIYGLERNKDEFSYSSTLRWPPGSVWCLWLVSFWASCSHEKSPGWALLPSGLRGDWKREEGEIMSDHDGPTTAQRPPCRWANTATNGRAGWTISRWMEAN